MTFTEAGELADAIDKIADSAYYNQGGLKKKAKLRKLYKEMDEVDEKLEKAKKENDKKEEEKCLKKIKELVDKQYELDPDPMSDPEGYIKFYNNFYKKHKLLNKLSDISYNRREKKERKKLGLK